MSILVVEGTKQKVTLQETAEAYRFFALPETIVCQFHS